MSSPDTAAPDTTAAGVAAAGDLDRLPPALSSMWRLCRLGFRYEPSLMGVSFALALVAAVPDALLAVWFKLLGEGLLEHKDGLLRLAVAALAVSVVATWLLQTVSTRVQRRWRVKVRGLVTPSPVGVAMLYDRKPSPPSPSPAMQGPFLMNRVVSISRPMIVMLRTLREWIRAVCR